MILLGYPGEISPADQLMGARGLWFVLSMLPFLYILWILFGELTRSLDRQSDRVKGLVGWLRLIVLITCLTTAMLALFCSVLFKKTPQAMMTTYLAIIVLFTAPLAAARAESPRSPALRAAERRLRRR